MAGQIKVTVQTEDRLQAIKSLSAAIDKVATALCACPQVVIKENVFYERGVIIDTAEKVMRTEIIELEPDQNDG